MFLYMKYLYCQGKCGCYYHLVSANFKKYLFAYCTDLFVFGFFRRHVLQGSFEYAWGIFSFSQRNALNILSVCRDFRIMAFLRYKIPINSYRILLVNFYVKSMS